jgi:hypothetical protein
LDVKKSTEQKERDSKPSDNKKLEHEDISILDEPDYDELSQADATALPPEFETSAQVCF